MKQSTLLKRSIPSLNNGFTLIELIVGGAVSLIVLSITLGLVVEQRRLFVGDQTRVDANQNLRAASDFLSTDIKQVGERLNSSSPLPVVQVFDGSGSDPDTIILQRKLLLDELDICSAISTSDTEITVADTNAGCNFSDGNSDNLTDSLGEFKSYRCDIDSTGSCSRGANDSSSAAIATIADCDNECVYAYIYDPSNDRGEFFLYTDETYEQSSGETVNKLKVLPTAGSNFQYSYAANSNSKIYILEEKKYGLCDGVLQLTTNQQPAYGSDCPYPNSSPQPVRLVDGIADFQVQILTAAGGQSSSWNNNLSSLQPLSDISSIEFTLETEANEQINTDTDTLVLNTEIFPRNAKSDF